MRNALSSEHILALPKIVEPIHDGKFDFSTKEKIAYTFIGGLAVYFSWESAKFYFALGGEGTKYLPIGNFTPEFGGQAAFWCNASLNWYFMIDTLIQARNAYYYYQFAKEINILPTLWKPALKLGIAFILAVTTGVVFGLIAGTTSDHSLYNQIVTAAVNILLNYLGCIALENLFINAYNKTSDWCCSQENAEDPEPAESALQIRTHLNEAADALQNDEQDWNRLKQPTGHQNFIAAASQKTSLLVPTTEKKCCSPLNILSGVVHLIMQFANGVALYGFLKDTIKCVGDLVHSTNPDTRTVLGVLTFIPFAALTVKVVFDTTQAIGNLITDAIVRIRNFINDPDWSKETFIKLGFIVPAALIATFGYFLAYVSANTSLDLNADYGWNDWWNTYPTCLGALMFNGFGFLAIIMTATTFLMSYPLYTSEKREVIHRHNQVTSFFESYPDALDKLAEQGNSLECNFEF